MIVGQELDKNSSASMSGDFHYGNVILNQHKMDREIIYPGQYDKDEGVNSRGPI